jgi:hypothetical protein
VNFNVFSGLKPGDFHYWRLRSGPRDKQIEPLCCLIQYVDFTLARTGNVVLPHVSGVLVGKSAARCTADTVSILRRDLSPTTANQIVDQRKTDNQSRTDLFISHPSE